LREVASRIAGRARLSLILGHEGDGLTGSAQEACAFRARIPMATGVDSLNVATAAAVALYETSIFGRGSAR
jgi:tRNA G18 (ribose-2'-O)-methylase SpoU